ncbi:hypothetical protein N658DRAFT_494420 [Parathielavia hyrcaniae]|uniref:Uncharacterized protein n=1 Tax=Parathielavia hyrcaniae TaxID=113614 RepID=A0AAN6Q3Y9_9PEZI|nr:hypothetical protein N658DRAFT_494420 [Parathielavia hyrcaniae]
MSPRIPTRPGTKYQLVPVSQAGDARTPRRDVLRGSDRSPPGPRAHKARPRFAADVVPTSPKENKLAIFELILWMTNDYDRHPMSSESIRRPKSSNEAATPSAEELIKSPNPGMRSAVRSSDTAAMPVCMKT